jgi:SanA protein
MLYFKKSCLLLLLLIIVIIVSSNIFVNMYANRFLYDALKKLPINEYGLVLGTNKYLPQGGINQFFEGRVKGVQQLYVAGKIKKIIVSGYRESVKYDEPAQIKNMLLKYGVPDSVIILDTVGHRTIQSIQNLSKISGLQRVTIISQRFHNQRAVYLACHKGYTAVGYNVADVHSSRNARTYMREIFAKTLAFFEIVFER